MKGRKEGTDGHNDRRFYLLFDVLVPSLPSTKAESKKKRLTFMIFLSSVSGAWFRFVIWDIKNEVAQEEESCAVIGDPPGCNGLMVRSSCSGKVVVGTRADLRCKTVRLYSIPRWAPPIPFH
jgi:hypothetical protein